MDLVLICAGLAGLVLGSHATVLGARGLARQFHVSELVIGLTVTSVGTSLPEIATNLAAALSSAAGVDASGIAIGNIIGSNLSQITLLLGAAGLVARLTIPRRALRRESAAVFGAMMLSLLASIDGIIARWEGGLLVAAYAVYIAGVIVTERRARRGDAQAAEGDTAACDAPPRRVAWDTLLVLIGLCAVVAAADVLVDHAVGLARVAGLDEAGIGLLVGLGTGLPELAVSLQAIIRGSGALSIGNLLGSNITDPLLSLGLGAAVHPVLVPEVALLFDFPYWVLGTSVALLLLLNHLGLNRKESSILILLYAMFLYLRFAGIAAP
jgi:cation:H+ antiporter